MDDNHARLEGLLALVGRQFFFCLVALFFTSNSTANAATLKVTLLERDFGSFQTLDEGAVWTGEIESSTFASVPNTDFLIDHYTFDTADHKGGPLRFETGLSNHQFDGTPQVQTDGNGDPSFLSNPIWLFQSLPHSFSVHIAVMLNGVPNDGFSLTFNTVGNFGHGPNGNEGTWFLTRLPYDGISIGAIDQLRAGTYSISAVPLPAAALLMGPALLVLGRRARL